jgi:putative phosphoribosyl transferase
VRSLDGFFDSPRFADREAAGRALAPLVASVCDRSRDAARLVLALPRGGVPVAVPVAAALSADLEVVVAAKVAEHGHPELGLGAVAEDGPPVWDLEALRRSGLHTEDLAAVTREAEAEVRRRVERYRNGRPLPSVAFREVVVVDDGIATGVTVRATLRWLRRCEPPPRRVVVSTPVCSRYAAQHACADADAVVCVAFPDPFGAVSRWYDEFAQLTDADVVAALGA